MRTKSLGSLSLVALMLLFFCNLANAAPCHPYIEQLSNGDIQYSITFANQQQHVEVFVRQNGIQNIAANITSSRVNNSDGTFTYSYTSPASVFSTNDDLVTRFYSFMPGQPGVFSPGPSEGVWSTPYLYNQVCDNPNDDDNTSSCHPYITQLSNGDIRFSVTFDTQQHHVEAFARQNGLQNLAANITGSGAQNQDGTYTYSYTSPASNFTSDDNIITRFYSYAPGQPGVFTPGPTESTWSDTYIYDQVCNTDTIVIYVSLTGSDDNDGSISSPVRTIRRGYQLASEQGATEVRVAEGTYEEGSFQSYSYNHITIVNGISLLGGYSADFSTRDVTFTSHITKLVGPNGGTQQAGPRMIIAENITAPTIIEGFEISKGVSHVIGGGIYVLNSNANLIIRNNRIVDNYASYQGRGGNIAIENSSSKVLNNIIIYGFSGTGYNGNDLYISGNYNGNTAEVAYNLFTNSNSVLGADQANFHDNSFMSQIVFVSPLGDDSNNGTVDAPLRSISTATLRATMESKPEIRVAAGVYNEANITIYWNTKLMGGYATSFIARDLTHTKYLTTIDGINDDRNIIKIASNNILLEGFKITNGKGNGSYGVYYINGGGINVRNASNVEIRNNIIENNEGGNIYAYWSHLILHDNQIINGFESNGTVRDLTNIAGYGMTNITYSMIYNNLFTQESSVTHTLPASNFYNNTYLYATRSGFVAENESANGLQLAITDNFLNVTGNQGNVSVQVIDINGQSTLSSASNLVDLGGLQNGFYIIHASDATNIATMKVIIQK